MQKIVSDYRRKKSLRLASRGSALHVNGLRIASPIPFYPRATTEPSMLLLDDRWTTRLCTKREI